MTADVGRSFQRAERFVLGGQSAWQMLVRESTESGITAYTTFVYQPSAGYIDDVVAMRRDTDGPYIPAEGESSPSGTTAAIQHWYHADDMFTVAALTDATGAVAERYHYDDYGSVRILDGDFNLRVAGASGRIESAVGNPHGFTGREWDAESGLWQYRYRYMSPSLGRFVSRDPLGVWGDELNRGSASAMVGNRPSRWLDPFGLVVPDGNDSPRLTSPPEPESKPQPVAPPAVPLAPPSARDPASTSPSDYILPTIDAVAPWVPLLGTPWDVKDLCVAIYDGSPSDIACCMAAFIPGGDILKTGKKLDKIRDATKVNSPEKQALVDMAQKDKKTGITEEDMKTYKELNDQLPDPFPKQKVRGPEEHPNRGPSSRDPHGHVGPVDHIPIKSAK